MFCVPWVEGKPGYGECLGFLFLLIQEGYGLVRIPSEDSAHIERPLKGLITP